MMNSIKFVVEKICSFNGQCLIGLLIENYFLIIFTSYLLLINLKYYFIFMYKLYIKYLSQIL